MLRLETELRRVDVAQMTATRPCPRPELANGGAPREGAHGASPCPIREESPRCAPTRPSVCPEITPLCALAGPCVPCPGRPKPSSTLASARQGGWPDSVRRQQQVAEQRVCRRDAKRPRHLEGVQVLSQQSAPGGIRTPNLLIRNTRRGQTSGSAVSPRDSARWLTRGHGCMGWGHVGVSHVNTARCTRR